MPIQKPRLRVTWVCGASLGALAGSFVELPMVKAPGEIQTKFATTSTVRAAVAVLPLGSMALLTFAVVRYWQAYAFARLPSQLAMVVALTLLFEVAVMLLWGQVWHWSWLG